MMAPNNRTDSPTAPPAPPLAAGPGDTPWQTSTHPAFPSDAHHWHGGLHLEFSRQGAQTTLSRSFVQAPLKVQRPFYPEGESVCHVVTLHTAGGIVGGDRLSTQIALQPGAQALITTAAAGKLYRSNGQEAQQTTQIQIAAGACLEWLPQESIVFDGARVRQALRVDLAAEALWLGWEITRFGRSARGERFAHGAWRSHLEVWQNGAPVWIDPQRLDGGSDMLTHLHGLAGHPVVGSFALVGCPVSSEVVAQARALWASRPRVRPPFSVDGPDALAQPADPGLPDQAEMGVSRLRSGLICRYRGGSTLEARRWFTAVWEVVRPAYLRRPACKPRVW